MNKFLIAQSKVVPTDFVIEDLDTRFRKATMNMILSTLACEKTLQHLPQENRSDIAIVFATHFGEVESSLDFLSIYRQSQVARPLLFQNSLHNSSLGFVSLTLELTGPGMTISADELTESAAHLTVDSMLSQVPYALLCFIDYIPEPLQSSYLHHHPYLGKFLNQATAFLYSRQQSKLDS